MNIKDYLKNTAELVEKKLNTLIPEKITPFSLLFESARYSLLDGGKRLRPILTLATAEAFEASNEPALTVACAIEMIHTYSLIHDDLPCMDDDDFRRGKPSLHKVFGEGQAVLTGDYLLTFAFELIADDLYMNNEKKIALIALIAKSAGSQGMIAGQVMDILAEVKSIDLESLKLIHQYKTGALIKASILAGAILGNPSPEELQLLHKFGNDIGLAFQIVDDVIDVTSNELKKGLSLSSDEENHKTTYVSLLGVDQSRKAAEALFHSAIHHLSQITKDLSIINELAKCLVYRDF